MCSSFSELTASRMFRARCRQPQRYCPVSSIVTCTSTALIDLGSTLNIIKKSGSWFSYGDTKLAQGRDAAKQCIIDNPELADELEQQIFEKLKG